MQDGTLPLIRDLCAAAGFLGLLIWPYVILLAIGIVSAGVIWLIFVRKRE